MDVSAPERVCIAGLSKSYNVAVLRGLDLSLKPGEIHGLVGENGAGKSTLINILCGLVKPNTGEIRIDGQAYQPQHVEDAMHHGVSVALQEFSLIDDLSVAENILLRRLPRRAGLIDKGECKTRTLTLLKHFELQTLPLNTLLGELSLAQKQLVEICKALSEPCKILILDEPTAALSKQQSDLLHTLMHSLASSGMTILYVSHRLDDIVEHCDRISVLCDGSLVSTCESSDTDTEQLIEHMSKGVLNTPYKQGNPLLDDEKTGANRDIVLQAKACCTKSLPHPINLTLHKGEILGIAGLAGSGRTELLEALYGLTPLKQGSVMRHENGYATAIKNAQHAVSLKIGMLAEDRKQQGIFAQQSLGFNASIAHLLRVTKHGLVKHSKLANLCRNLFSDLSVKHDSLSQNIEDLSGGNQQKVLLARWLFAGTEIFLLDEPTRGVDVATKASIYQHLASLTAQGASVLVVSSEIEELFSICDRVKVMSEQKVVGQLTASQFDMDKVLQLAFTHQPNSQPQSQSHSQSALNNDAQPRQSGT